MVFKRLLCGWLLILGRFAAILIDCCLASAHGILSIEIFRPKNLVYSDHLFPFSGFLILFRLCFFVARC